MSTLVMFYKLFERGGTGSGMAKLSSMGLPEHRFFTDVLLCYVIIVNNDYGNNQIDLFVTALRDISFRTTLLSLQ